MANITKRTNGAYLVRISCGTDESGKPIQRSKTFKPSSPTLSKAQIKKELEQFVFRFENETDEFGDSITAKVKDYSFADFCKEYKRVKKLTLSPSTWDFYEHIIDSLLVPKLGRLKLSQIRPCHAQKIIEILMKPANRRDGKSKVMSAATIRRYVTVLQSVMTLACKQGYIKENPAETKHLELPRIMTPEVEVFNEDEIRQILDGLSEEPLHIKALISVALYTGARRGEIVGLKWSDINLETGVVSITRSVVKVPGKRSIEKSTKTEKSMRCIAIPEALCEILTEYREEQNVVRKSLGDDWFDGDYLFTEDDGHVMNPQTPTKQFDHFLKRHGIRHLKFHGLRHTSATILLSKGCDIKTVSKRLGHTDISTTNIYVHMLEKADRNAADVFDQIAGGE